MNRVTKIALPLAVAGLLGAAPSLARAGANEPQTPPHRHTAAMMAAMTGESAKLEATQAALRDLWLGHAFWVRNVVVSGFAGDKVAQQVAEQQVVENAKAIAAAIEPFYGAAARDKLFGLLAGHYGAVRAYLDATIADNPKRESDATTKLLDNAEAIAVFLSSANPNLPHDAVLGLLQAHAGHHITEIQELHEQDYAGEAKTWADMSRHMYVIADALADAIAKQFPKKF